MSPTKIGVVLDLIRGKDVSEVFVILKYASRDAAEAISRVSESAVANAENNHESDANRLLITEAHIGHGSTLKRFRPMGHGKAFRISKRTSNIVLAVKERA